MSKRIAIAAAILLLLVQAAPVLACVGMPTQALAACCCESHRDCAMGHHANGCSKADACCVDAVNSTPVLGNAAAQPDERPVLLPSANGAPPVAESLAHVGQQASVVAAHFYLHRSAPCPAVPLYLRHLRLTL